MHLLILGATGPSGIAVIDAALQAGHELTIYARSPKKLSWEVLNNQKVHTIEGTFEDEKAIQKAVRCGAKAVISCAGPMLSNRGKGTPVTDFYARLYQLILNEPDCSIRRCLVLCTPSYPVKQDGRSIRFLMIVNFIWAAARFAFNEIIASAELTTAQPVDRLGWTLFRVPLLTNSAAGSVHAGFLGDGKDGVLLSRKSMAIWLVEELKEAKWVGRAPLLSDA